MARHQKVGMNGRTLITQMGLVEIDVAAPKCGPRDQ